MNKTFVKILEFIRKESEGLKLTDYIDLLERLRDEIEMMLDAAKNDLK